MKLSSLNYFHFIVICSLLVGVPAVHAMGTIKPEAKPPVATKAPVPTPRVQPQTNYKTTDGVQVQTKKITSTTSQVNIFTKPAGNSNMSAAIFPKEEPKPIITHAPPTKIFFQSGRDLDPLKDAPIPNGNGALNIWTINSDGTGATPLTSFSNVSSVEPVLSPDHTKILFRSDGDLAKKDATLSVWNIWVMNIDGSNLKPLTKNIAPRVWNNAPDWSPDGTKIVFESNRDLDPNNDNILPNYQGNGTNNIWVMDSDGNNAYPLTELTKTFNFSPKWSPDGTKILFISKRDLSGRDDISNIYNLWVMNADGTGATPLTKNMINFQPLGFAGVESANWSPDGKKIVFSDLTDIWVMNADGTGATSLTKLKNCSSSSAQWSPDGKMIAFSSDRDLNPLIDNPMRARNLWVMNADGTGAKSLTPYRFAIISNYSGW